MDWYRPAPPQPPVRAVVIAAGAEILFELFLCLSGQLGSVVDLVFESSHFRSGPRRREFRRRQLDRTVMESYLCEFEDTLVRDGCAGLAVIDSRTQDEIQFDEHKSLLVYTADRSRFCAICRRFGLHCIDDLTLVSEVAHIHRTSIEQASMFRELTRRFGSGW